MKAFSILRSTFLASTLLLTSLPGCQGEDTSDTEPAAPLATTAQPLVCGNMVPVMTGPSTPSGAVTRSGVYSADYEAWKAFDNATTMWISAEGQAPAWIAYQPSTTTTIHRYALEFWNGPGLTSRAPKNWTFDGWNGSTWTVLDTRTNQSSWTGNDRREFTLAAPASYIKYRLNVTDDNDPRAGIVVISLSRLELITCANDGVTNPATPVWTRTFGAAGAPTQVMDLSGDSAGRSYVTGYTSGGVNGAPMVGLMDSFIQARNWDGVITWSKPIGAPGSVALGYGIATSSNFEEIAVAGFTDGSVDGTPKIGNRDAFLTKYRYTAARQWTRQVGGAGFNTEGYDTAFDTSGNSFLMGSTYGGLDGNTLTGTIDVFVTKFDSLGNKLWTRQAGVAGKITHGRRAAADASGNVYVSGWTLGGLDGNPLMGTQDLFVIKYDGAGNKQWTRQLGSSGNGVWLYGSETDAAGNVYLTGQSGGGLGGNPNTTSGGDVYLAKYDPSGNMVWTREFSATYGIWASGIFIDDTGVYVSGGGQGDVGNPSNTAYSVAHNYVAKFNSAGTRLAVVQQSPAFAAGAPAAVYANGINVTFDGYVYLGGYTSGNFGGNSLIGTTDSFVTKLPFP
ncbi:MULTISPECIES: SBBP repeat-containing protein [Corallococcus]|uniref:SBBP repeat-containing protein n=1 Tax=Corallococcus TaxID=83461 RepID=UPI00117F6A20|nr:MULTISPECIES: SBBP repeat-containing protein [Corallococcus]NBD07942.1 hypothetical protein [Corallococcus silvisoli]TSC33924.1 hypothetical protein FOF48_02425 [Corallococcus sp. Z5C101001]